MTKKLFEANEVPPEQFLKDLQLLLSLDPAARSKAFELVTSFYSQETSQAREEAARKTLSGWSGDRAQMKAVVNAAIYLVDRAFERNARLEELVAEVAELVSPNEVPADLRAQLDRVLQSGPGIVARKREGSALAIGLPRATNLLYSCELRAVYGAGSFEKELDSTQPYFTILRWVPAAVFELQLELNEKKETVSLLATLQDIHDIHDITGRALQRMKAVEDTARRLNESLGGQP